MIENITTNGVLETVSSSPFGYVLNFLYVFLGGIFGLYVIFFIIKLYINFKYRNDVKEIKKSLIEIKKAIKILDNKVDEVSNTKNTNNTNNTNNTKNTKNSVNTTKSIDNKKNKNVLNKNK